MKFYHGTSEEVWEKIQEEGILWGIHPDRYTYLTPDMEIAKRFGGGVILEVEYQPKGAGVTDSEGNLSDNYGFDPPPGQTCWQFAVFNPIPLASVKRLQEEVMGETTSHVDFPTVMPWILHELAMSHKANIVWTPTNWEQAHILSVRDVGILPGEYDYVVTGVPEELVRFCEKHSFAPPAWPPHRPGTYEVGIGAHFIHNFVWHGEPVSIQRTTVLDSTRWAGVELSGMLSEGIIYVDAGEYTISILPGKSLYDCRHVPSIPTPGTQVKVRLPLACVEQPFVPETVSGLSGYVVGAITRPSGTKWGDALQNTVYVYDISSAGKLDVQVSGVLAEASAAVTFVFCTGCLPGVVPTITITDPYSLVIRAYSGQSIAAGFFATDSWKEVGE